MIYNSGCVKQRLCTPCVPGTLDPIVISVFSVVDASK